MESPTVVVRAHEGLHRPAFASQRLNEFWRFVTERQRIWEARFVHRSPPPWTQDTILQTQRFTNVYRELDPGTRYAIDSILEVDAPRPDRVFNIMLYRLIGRIETHRELGFQHLNSFKSTHLERTLKRIRTRGDPPFTAAYLVSGYRSMGSSDKAVNVTRLFEHLHGCFSEFYSRLVGADRLSEAYSAIRDQDGFGNFLAYQTLVDLLYPLRREGGRPLLPFSHDDWAAAGPGAQKGISILCPQGGLSNLDAMRWLRTNQRLEFARLGLEFPFLRDSNGKEIELSLANIQNCLCEFYKYTKIREGRGRGRRLFDPRLAERARQLPLLAYIQVA